MSSLTQFFGGGGGSLTNGATNVVYSNPRRSDAPTQLGATIRVPDSPASGTTITKVVHNAGYNDIEFLEAISLPSPVSGITTSLRVEGLTTVKNLSFMTTGLNSAVQVQFYNETNAVPATTLTTLDGFNYVINTTFCSNYILQCNTVPTLAQVNDMYIHFVGGGSKSITWSFNGCSLNQASVDEIIISLNNAVQATNMTASGSCDLRRGSNAAPSGAASTAISQLTSRGVNVVTN